MLNGWEYLNTVDSGIQNYLLFFDLIHCKSGQTVQLTHPTFLVLAITDYWISALNRAR